MPANTITDLVQSVPIFVHPLSSSFTVAIHSKTLIFACYTICFDNIHVIAT